MAYADDEKDKNKPGSNAPQGVTTGSAGVNAGVDRGGSSFPDISRYLSQNRDAANRTASRIGNQVTSQASDARARLADARNQFGQQVQAGTPQYDPNLINQAKSDPASLFQYQQPPAPQMKNKGGKQNNASNYGNMVPFLSGQKSSNPINYTDPNVAFTANDPNQISQFQNALSAQYTGPTELTDQQGYSDIVNSLQGANEQAVQTQSDVGRMDLLNDLYGAPGTRGGVSMLDNLLLKSGDAGNVLNRSTQGIEGLNAEFSDTEAQAAADATKAFDDTESARNSLNEEFLGEGGIAPSFLEEVRTGAEGIRSRNKKDDYYNQNSARLRALNELLGTEFEF